MVPTIQDGSILHVAPIQGAKLQIGDIVLIRKGAEFKAHRIVSRRGRALITRGDAGVEADSEISCDQALGVVIAVEREDHRIRLYGVRARLYFLARERWRRFRYRVNPQSKSESLS